MPIAQQIIMMDGVSEDGVFFPFFSTDKEARHRLSVCIDGQDSREDSRDGSNRRTPKVECSRIRTIGSTSFQMACARSQFSRRGVV